MKKILLFTASLLCAASMWADPVIEGPWTLKDSGTKEKAKIANDSIAFNDYYAGSEWWGDVNRVTDANGFGFNWDGTSPANRMRGTFAVFTIPNAVVPPYTSMNVNWAFKLSSKSTKHYSTVCIYGIPCSSDSIQKLKVPFTNRFDKIEDKSTIKGLLAWYFNKDYSGNVESSDTLSATLSFDNRAGSTEQTKEWSMMMAFIVGSADNESTSNLDESGYFKSLHIDTTWTYFKVFTFNANGGAGEMAQAVAVDDGGSLPTNTYYREGYSFAGWSTTPNGYVDYTDCATVTTSAEDNGPRTLYAVWKEWGHSTKEGPWTQSTVKSHACAKNTLPSISINEMDNSSWNMAVVQNISGEYGIGCAYSGHSVAQSKMGVFSTYRYQVEVPAYARMTMKWRFSLFSKTTQHHATTCLYAGEGTSNSVDTLKVDFSNHYDTQTGKENLLARLTRYDQQGDEGNRAYIPVRNTGFVNRTFTFDNIDGSEQQLKNWYLLLTHVVASGDDPKSGLDEWATFKSLIVDTTWTYRKIVTFNANEGSGEMANQTIENSGTLTANAFTRDNHTFAGWATSANGPVVYADAAEITANEYSKGPVTLYAVWTQVNYSISYELNEGSVETPNPTSYNPETATFTLANPTKTGFTFLGWTGSNGAIPQTAVSIAKGSTGDKTYTAHWINIAVTTTIDLIDNIGPVEYAEAIKAKIDAARDAYNALSEEDKALVYNYSTLTAAEEAYENMDGNTTIMFLRPDATNLSNQTIQLDYPEAPKITGFTFQYWRVAGKNLSDGTIRLQAVYTSTPTDIDETIVNGQSSNRKFIKDGNLYILKDEFIYTINGQRVNK